ncbi:hypothetical protein [Paenibacillus glycanilyticus]|uniref:Hydrolase n=1 Tax=Paenibacillus glycanilyticus TaxID=126569 RepID=A0ABQ6GF21_9BACL|nr:hypothetical protein [Paenibacillus glycanilyticus]GLX69564.1 hypothetical protein MU1_39090 [Paenibacillus glycanilyticus]
MSGDERKKYYVSVQAGQILRDQGAASYELEIMADYEEYNQLQVMFEELSSMDNAITGHYNYTVGTLQSESSDNRMNAGYDAILHDIYLFIHEHGTESTRKHVESMGILDPGRI